MRHMIHNLMHICVFSGLTGSSLRDHIESFLRHIHSTGIRVRALVLDAATSNISACKKLGCKFDAEDLKTSFMSEENEEIYVFLDVCHTLKLLRNLLGVSDLISARGRISWNLVNRLYEVQRKEGLHLANKLT